MKVGETKICIDCDEVFLKEGRECPACSGRYTILLSQWVPPLSSLENDLEVMKRMAASAGITCCEREGG